MDTVATSADSSSSTGRGLIRQAWKKKARQQQFLGSFYPGVRACMCVYTYNHLVPGSARIKSFLTSQSCDTPTSRVSGRGYCCVLC